MKRVALVLCIGAVGATAVAVTSSPASQEAVSPARVAALEKKVTAQGKTMTAQAKKVTKLTTDLTTLTRAVSSCLLVQAVPMTSYGTQTEGYLYRLGDGQTALTTALDIAEQGQEPQLWIIGTSSTCATEMNRPSSALARIAAAKAGVRSLDRESQAKPVR
jgi:uncharacterized membrane protein YgcG